MNAMKCSRLISENGIPFSMKVQDLAENKGILALREMGRISAEKGNSEFIIFVLDHNSQF